MKEIIHTFYVVGKHNSKTKRESQKKILKSMLAQIYNSNLRNNIVYKSHTHIHLIKISTTYLTQAISYASCTYFGLAISKNELLK